ncbi:helix-turn-helix domain-containing protein [Sporolactobacillus kofuensis]|uniref:Helix-turn-helix domain-containing protein n=1 Tax=Sporolactobacillus kofuensis TaxID=269672 RepID=A0ABW1WE51_9BACL|nr:helix-turn-helix domain-containing protein [Sporolactobacillus kofuensis]MCO7174922.1 helix-turn-helix domain-containing protein [Sporolactobacillus kofuensis]
MTYSQHLRPDISNSKQAFDHLLRTCQPLIRSLTKKYAFLLHERVTHELILECQRIIREVDQIFDPTQVPKGITSERYFFNLLRQRMREQLKHYVKKKLATSYCDLVQETQSPYKIRRKHISYHPTPHVPPFFPSFTENQYTFYRMHIIHGYSIQQIAAMHRVSQQTVRRWKRQTQHVLKNHFQR